jgi:hypothetical protein
LRRTHLERHSGAGGGLGEDHPQRLAGQLGADKSLALPLALADMSITLGV